MLSIKGIKEKFLLAMIIFSTFIFIGGMFDALYLMDSTMPTETMIDAETTWIAVFVNNLFGCIILISGFLVFGITTFIFLIFNALFLGMALVTSYATGATITDIVLAVLPHGIFEIPAVLLSAAIGFLGFKFYSQEDYKRFYINIGKLSTMVVILLLIASLVETSITIPLK